MAIPVIDTGRGHWHAVHLHEEEGLEPQWLAVLAADRADGLLTCIEFETYLSLDRVAVVPDLLSQFLPRHGQSGSSF